MTDFGETGPVVPFALRVRTRLPDAAGPGPDDAWDPVRQIWMSAASGRPLVIEHAQRTRDARGASTGDGLRASSFGETTLTKTAEGTDRSEAVGASSFGETLTTRTSEGTDQREVVTSDFGETVVTETREGTDQSETVRAASTFGETITTATREGTDHREAVS